MDHTIDILPVLSPEIPMALKRGIVSASVGSCLRPPTWFDPQAIWATQRASRSVCRVPPFVSQLLHPARQDVERADQVGILFKPRLTDKPRLGLAVVR